MIIECVLMTVSACQLAKTRIEYTLALIGPERVHINKVYILGEEYWKRTPYAQLNTETAYTVAESAVTNIRAEYVIGTTLQKLEHTLRHENGHLLCQCRDELQADRAGGN
jgi:hypothetical protein